MTDDQKVTVSSVLFLIQHLQSKVPMNSLDDGRTSVNNEHGFATNDR